MQKSKTSFESFLSDWNLASLREPALTQPPSPPKFPSFVQLAELDRSQPPPARSSSVFQALLGRAEPLYIDSLEHPEKYSPEAVALLGELIAGTKKLDDLAPAEQGLLDHATIDFASATPEKPRPPPQPAPRRAARAVRREPEAEPVAGVDVPADVQQPYWWLK